MVDESKIGTNWQDDELDTIVADYFDMLEADLSGRPYVKSRHSQALMAQIGRTHRSVEFKHQNISAVLDELGLPWIPGYKPKRNYQNAIFGAIDRYLSKRPEILQVVPTAPVVMPVSTEVFVARPVLDASGEQIPEGLKRLVRKFDPVERDHRNRSLGKAGEECSIDTSFPFASEHVTDSFALAWYDPALSAQTVDATPRSQLIREHFPAETWSVRQRVRIEGWRQRRLG